jgi:hypothetical protein
MRREQSTRQRSIKYGRFAMVVHASIKLKL